MKRKSILSIAVFLCFLVAGDIFSEEKKPAPASADAEPVISEIIVEIQNAPGNRSDELTEMAKQLIFVRKGYPFSAEKLQESLDALKLSKKFQTVHADSKESGNEIQLIFSLTPFRQIKDIVIEGAYPFFEKEILNAMTLYIGDAYLEAEIPKQSPLIERVFSDGGFLNPKAEVWAEEDPEDGNFILYIKIGSGSYYTVEQLEIKGNKSFSDRRLKLRMKTWLASLLPGGPGRFIEKNMKADVKDLIEYYRKKGYADVTIDPKIEKNTETQCVSIVVNINEGMRYDIEFEGNKEFWAWFTLQDDLVLFKEGNRNNLGIKKSIKNIRERYKKAGYLKAEVKTHEETNSDESIRKIKFIIDEGPQSVVHSIQVTGNEIFDEKKVKKQMLTREPGFLNDGEFVPETLDEDMEAVRSFYINNGYLDTQVNKDVKWSEDKKQVDVSVRVEEKIQTKISSLKITGLTVLPEEEARKALQIREGDPLKNPLLHEDERKLASMISEKGYPHVKIKGDISFSEDKSQAAVSYSVEEGPYTKMGKVYFSGNFRTKNKILLNELEVKPEAPFSLTKMLETQRNIRNMNVFDSVQFKMPGLKEKADKVSLFVETEEKKPYFAEVGVGYDTQRKLYAHAKSGDLNLFGLNRKVWVGGEVSQIGYQTEAGITEPRLFGSRTAMTFGLFAEEKEEFNQEFGTRLFGASLGFSRKWFEKLNTGLTFRFEQRSQFRHDSEESETSEIYNESEFEERRIFVTTPSVGYDSRDSFIRPRKGIYSALSLDFSQGLENSLDNFLKYRFDTRCYWSPVQRLTLACYGRLGYIEPFGSSEKVADDQLFFLGGITNVRGFDENLLRFKTDGSSLGGQTAVSGSLEARIDLGLNFELTTFYDVGKLSDTFDESDSQEFRSAVGLGLRYITPIGPIGLLYGFKLDREEGESSGRFHFSMGYTF